MAQMITSRPQASIGKLGDVDTTARMALGTRAMGVDDFGNTAEFIYLQGIGSTIVGSVVTYDEAGLTALIVANAVGPVAVACAITVASTYGWYCIAGTVLTALAAATADNGKLGFETTSGYVGDGCAAGDAIYGAVARVANAGGAAVGYAQWLYPSVNDASA